MEDYSKGEHSEVERRRRIERFRLLDSLEALFDQSYWKRIPSLAYMLESRDPGMTIYDLINLSSRVLESLGEKIGKLKSDLERALADHAKLSEKLEDKYGKGTSHKTAPLQTSYYIEDDLKKAQFYAKFFEELSSYLSNHAGNGYKTVSELLEELRAEFSRP